MESLNWDVLLKLIDHPLGWVVIVGVMFVKFVIPRVKRLRFLLEIDAKDE